MAELVSAVNVKIDDLDIQDLIRAEMIAGHLVSFGKMDLKDGDVLVVEIPKECISMGLLGWLKDFEGAIQRACGPNVRVFAAQEGFKFSIFRSADGACLMRRPIEHIIPPDAVG